jgi:hypothetical protein
MTVAKKDLVAALRTRYDHYSAESMFDAARERAGLDDKSAFDAQEIAKFRDALRKVGDRLGPVDAVIDELLAKPADAQPAAPPPAAAPAPAPKAAAPVTAAPAPEPAPAAKPAAPAPAAGPVETTIALAGVTAGEGEQILICGGHADLGNWDPEQARAMRRDGDAWITTVKVAPDTDAPFKFLRRGADGKVVWEKGDDRRLVAKPRIEATWR